ncbi:MAG: DNA-processing protein DprA [Bdellovibrionota bacterium]
MFYTKLTLSLIAMSLKSAHVKEYSDYLAKNLIYEDDNFLSLIEENFPNIIEKYNDKLVIDTVEENIAKWEKQDIKFLLLGTLDYPQALKNIYNPPLVLFYKGTWKKDYDYNFSVAIVGSRKASVMQTKFVNQFASVLSFSNICVVSGLAQGIDAASHMGAISGDANKFPTIAVLGSGVNYIYPAVHKYLAHKIIDKGGILLSHFLPDTAPFPYNFLDRNRVISGLSRIVIVAQAAARSGALSTARYALEQGRDLLAVLGPVYDDSFVGSNNLITQGATPIASVEDFFKLYPEYLLDKNLDKFEDNKIINFEDEKEKQVYEYIRKHKKVSREELHEKFTDSNLSLTVINLLARNLIESLPGDEYCLAQGL